MTGATFEAPLLAVPDPAGGGFNRNAKVKVPNMNAANDEIVFLDLLEVGRRIQSGLIRSAEVTELMLARIESLDPKLKSYVTVTGDAAREQARNADAEIAAGHIRGALHGVPVAVKDLLWTVGAPTSHGMPIHRDFRSAENATVVDRLLDSGAVLLGKLQQTEGAYGAHHPSIAAPVNPWGESLWSGVSSSGSGVAPAAGLCFASIGTDTGGSIRYPAAANGITGIKPSWGRVSRYGAFELAGSMDHIGPLARSTADAAAVLQAMAGADSRDPTASLAPVPDYLAMMTRGVRGLRVGIDRRWTIDAADDATGKCLLGALDSLQRLGAQIETVSFPAPEQGVEDWVPLCAVETALAHADTFPSRREEYGPSLAALIELGSGMRATDYQRLLARRSELRGRVDALFGDVDLLLVPVAARAGVTVDQMSKLGDDLQLFSDMMRYTTPFDLTGHPTITLPGGRTPNGAPVGFQLVAGQFREDLLVRAGWAYQQVTRWHLQHPDIS